MKVRCYEFTKRLFDFTASFLGIIFTSPFWIIAAIGIYISDPGPILYTARRIGKNNEEFAMYKFRSMRQGKADESVFRGEEYRIFPFGEFIRKCKIDELPQLLCCLSGSMSIIGPRPAAKDQMGIMRGGQYAVVANVKPGLSGPAAIYDYIYGDTINDDTEYQAKVLPTRLALELFYVQHRSWLYDIKMIYYTIICILGSVVHKVPNKILHELVNSIKEPVVEAGNTH